MRKTASHFASDVPPSISDNAALMPRQKNPKSALRGEKPTFIGQLETWAEEYLLDCEYRQHSRHTLRNNRCFLSQFFHFLKQRDFSQCGRQEIRAFLHYLQQPLKDGGREVRPITARTYHRCLSTFFKWLIEEEIVSENPMEKIKAPTVRQMLKEPLSDEQVGAMLEAAKTSTHKHRDTAILLFLLDTGVRAGELCELKRKDLDFQNRSARILGKGNKLRMVYWGIGTSKALLRYLRQADHQATDPVFTADRGTGAGEALTPSGLYQLMERLGQRAGVKCGCHDWRRTFAVKMLTNGANLISVSRLMGHESLEITKGYLSLAQTDIEKQHRQFSPADRLRRRCN